MKRRVYLTCEARFVEAYKALSSPSDTVLVHVCCDSGVSIAPLVEPHQIPPKRVDLPAKANMPELRAALKGQAGTLQKICNTAAARILVFGDEGRQAEAFVAGVIVQMLYGDEYEDDMDVREAILACRAHLHRTDAGEAKPTLAGPYDMLAKQLPELCRMIMDDGDGDDGDGKDDTLDKLVLEASTLLTDEEGKPSMPAPGSMPTGARPTPGSMPAPGSMPTPGSMSSKRPMLKSIIMQLMRKLDELERETTEDKVEETRVKNMIDAVLERYADDRDDDSLDKLMREANALLKGDVKGDESGGDSGGESGDESGGESGDESGGESGDEASRAIHSMLYGD